MNKYGKMGKINFNLEYSSSVVDYILDIVKDDKEYGARPVIRAIQDEIENRITDMILENDYVSGQTFNVDTFCMSRSVVDETLKNEIIVSVK